MKKTLYTIIAITTIALVSCTKDDAKDTTRPVIEIFEPANGDTLFIGYGVHLEMDLSDNESLKSYKIDIHDDFDGHDHGKKSTADGAWSFSRSWDISGLKNTRIHHHEIEVPTTVNGVPIEKGNYHFTVYCTDEAGNESFMVRDVVIWEGTPDNH